MLKFFTDPYEEEILYSVIARYHYFSGNKSYQDTFQELFGENKRSCSLVIPSCIKHLSEQLPPNSKYNINYIIANHTLLPIVFNTAQKLSILLDLMRTSGKGLVSKSGLANKKHGSTMSIYYCPNCVRNDMEKYGEAYFHRIHQLDKIEVCPHHGCLLEKYPVKAKELRSTLVRLVPERVSLLPRYENNMVTNKHLKAVSQAAHWILRRNKNPELELVEKTYKYYLQYRGFLFSSGNIQYQKLINELTSHYGLDFLSKINFPYNKVGLKRIITGSLYNRATHPVNHIVLILFLEKNIESFFNNCIKGKQHLALKNAFGDGPWPCLNPTAKHYKENIITKCIVKNGRNQEIVGTFICTCGFIYTRRGPDETGKNNFNIDKVTQYGLVWEKKLEDLIINKNIKTLRKLAIEMSCSKDTVKKYVHKLELLHLLKYKVKTPELVSKPVYTMITHKIIEEYKGKIIQFMSENPGCSRNLIAGKLRKYYRAIRRYDEEWFNNHIPPAKYNNRKHKYEDFEILKNLKQAFEKIIQLDNYPRITKTRMCKEIGIPELYRHILDELPQSKYYINQIVAL